MMGFLAATSAATAGFLALHWGVARRARQSFRRNLKLSRGLAAAVLVGTGIAALARWAPLWRQGFVVEHAGLGDTWPVVVFTAHLVADLAWLGGGRVFLSARAARDLVIHHLLGVAGCLAALHFHAAYALVGAVLVSEVLPVLTGIGAWARMRDRPGLERGVLRASLAALVGFRLPLWLLLAGTLGAALATGDATAVQRTVAPAALPAFAFVVVLDLYWISTYVRLLRQFPRRGVPDLPIDPLAPLVLDPLAQPPRA